MQRKTLGISAAVITLLLPAMAFVPAHAQENKPSVETHHAGKPMAMMPMHEQMQRMRKRMHQMDDPGNSEQRHKRMGEHMASMQEMMKMMNGMMAGHQMMRGSPGPASHAAPEGAMPSGSATETVPHNAGGRMNLVEERLNLLQIMMEQILENQAALLEQAKS